MPLYKINIFAKNFYSLKQAPSIKDIAKVEMLNERQTEVRSCLWTELIFVIRGSGNITIEKNTYPISKGDIAVIRPNVPRYEERGRNDGDNARLCYYRCCMENYEASMMPLNHLLAPSSQHIFETGEMEERFLAVLTEIYEELGARNEWYADICNNLSYEIAMLTLRLFCEKNDLSLQLQNGRDIDQVRKFLDDHFIEKIKTTMIAKELGMSRQTMYRLFQKEKFSPVKYITQKRIGLARRLIAETGESLQNIAYETGYSDYSSFFVTFKKETGVSPNEYRRFLIEENPVNNALLEGA
ncbi:MAG: AraC family transcriptional regulator [Treponema sp.]|jgi:AraC-like DNA-binding protein/mannose-6-phosphate isomerase-like protein (cupin superfamily)|nr:AraC family transcriptional regulator [Treponema sp.]